jgi:hypothetical protein
MRFPDLTLTGADFDPDSDSDFEKRAERRKPTSWSSRPLTSAADHVVNHGFILLFPFLVMRILPGNEEAVLTVKYR